MRQINLLPNELKPDKRAGLALKKTEKIFVIILIIYLLIVGSSIGATYYLNQKFKLLETQKTQLSAELKNLSSVETSTVYIRDRIEKFSTLEGKDIEKVNLDKFEKVFLNMPANAEINTINLSENNISYSVDLPSNDVLSLMFNKLIESGEYKNITVSGLNYDLDSGYSFTLTIDF